MRKIYSLVLMATMLLMGANAWAATHQVSDASLLQSTLAAANDGDEIVLNSSTTFFENATPLWLGTGKHVILNLNGLKYTFTGTSTLQLAIAVTHGTLEIKNGKIDVSGVEDLVRVYGTTNPYDASDEADTYSRLIVRESAELISSKNVISVDVMRADQPAKFGQTWNTTNFVNCAKQSNNYGLANGVRVDVEGKLSATKYGIKVNGMVRNPEEFTGLTAADKAYTPYIYIHETGYVSTHQTASEATAAYSSGYGRWLVKGYCGGSTGLYIKSGEIDLDGAVITSTNSTATAAHGLGHGVEAGGSAIVIESNANFSGNVSLTIKGDTEVSATSGYAIEETITTSQGSKVTQIAIQGGSISGGSEGAIIVEQATANGNKVSVAGGSITGNVELDTDSNSGQQGQVGPTETTQPLDLTSSSSPISTTGTVSSVEVDGKTVIVINNQTTPTTQYAIHLNDSYLATFSALEAVKLPDGLKAYKAGSLNGTELAVTAIAEGGETVDVIPAATGVILYNEAKNTKDFDLTVVSNPTAAAVATVGDNNLKPEVAWTVNYSGEAYILHGNELWLYTGLKMADNKAFLVLPTTTTNQQPNTAPQRIRMVFNQEQNATAVESVEAESVKAVKFMGADGQLYIRRGDVVYTVQGQVVK